MRLGALLMPSHPPERSIRDGQRWDLDDLERLDALGFEEAWIGEHFTAVWEPYQDRRRRNRQGGITSEPAFDIRSGADFDGPVKTDSRAVSGAAPRDDLESVTLVDGENNVVGSCGKLAAHHEGRLHRAFSILITNPNSELLLQRRAAHKYHFANRSARELI